MSNLVTFVKDAYHELLMVKWPKKDQTIRLTAYVIGVSLAVGLFITAVDYLFNEVLEIVFR